MKINRMTPMLWTEDLEGTIAFYTTHLGFICGDRNDEWGWAGLFHGDIDLMVAKPNAHTQFDNPMFTGSLYFVIDDVNKLWESLRDNVEIVYTPEDFEWEMREFAIRDNNGYLLQFGQDLKE